jgi:hypothetical protein
MKISFCVVLSIFLLACDKENTNSHSELPECIQNFVESSQISSTLKTIRSQEVNNEIHYWLNTGFVNIDGEEFVVNNSCDTICYFCSECFPPDCSFSYNSEDWKIIWRR